MLIKYGSAKNTESELLVENRTWVLPCSQSRMDIKNVRFCSDICVVLFFLPGCVCGSRPAPSHLHHIQRGKQLMFIPVFRIRIRNHIFLALPDPAPVPDRDPDPSIIKQKK